MTAEPAWTISEDRGRAGLRRLEGEWRSLYARMPGRSSLVSFEACAAHLDHCLEDPDRVRCVVLSDGREARAMALLEPRTERRLGFRIGVWGVLWLNQQAIHADIVGPDDEARRVFVPVLAEHLRRHPEGRRLLALGPLERDASLWEGLDRLDPSDLCLDPNERMRIMDGRQPFAQLEARCSKNFRHNMKAVRRRLAELPDVQFRLARGAQALAAELPVFLEVEASGWKGAGRSAIRHRQGLADYYAALAGTLDGEHDYCEIHALYTGNRCIASSFNVRTGATCSMLKIGYDEAYARFSPGHLLVSHILQYCCADPGIERMSFLGDAPWMRGWPAELVDLQVVLVNIGGPVGRVLTTLLRFRLGPLRRLARRLQPMLRRLGLRVGEERP